MLWQTLHAMLLSLRYSPIARRRIVAIGLFAGIVLLASSCQRFGKGENEFLRAAGGGDLAKASALLDRNPGLISSKDKKGFTALHYAASYGYKDMAKLLLAKGADVNAKTARGDTPLHYTAAYDFKDITELLLSNKADPNITDGVGPRRCMTRPEAVG